MTGLQRISLAALVAVATGVGLLWGLDSRPPTETEVIEAAAADYVAETGGALTDCAARPADLPGIWLVVVCADGDWVTAYDRQGRVVEVGDAFRDGEPAT